MKKFGIFFPGQGSQYAGMLNDLGNDSLVIEYSSRAKNCLGFDLAKICRDGSAEDLKQTEITQPAIVFISSLYYDIMSRETGIKPFMGAGHSLGEYSALYAAGVLRLEDALSSVNKRGKYMQEAVPSGVGAMAAILGADSDNLIKVCEEISRSGDPSKTVSCANFNCSGQVVVSGHAEKVDELLKMFKGKLLEVSAPFHSPLMLPASEKMKDVLGNLNFRAPNFPVIANVDNSFHTEPEAIKNSLLKQITDPVKWDTGVKIMIEAGVTDFIEVGPGRVLAGLMKRIDRTCKLFNFHSVSELDSLKTFINS